MPNMKGYVDVFLSPSTQHYISNNTLIGIWWHKLSAAFWQPSFWLPDEYEWRDLEEREDLNFPIFHDVCVYPIIFGALLLLFKTFFLTPLVMDPLSRLAGIPNKRPRPPTPSKALEAVYQLHGRKLSKEQIEEVSGSTGFSTRRVERWLRRRAVVDKSTRYEKFVGCGFNLMNHTWLTVFGFYVLLSKPWLWDISETWKDYPLQHVDDGLWWYYITALSAYWASTFIQIHSPARSSFDRVQMMLHHLFTVLLLMFSWTCNFIRSGSLVLLMHEISDVPLLTAKILTYAGIKAPTDMIFVLFVVAWAVTRCYLYPFWIMRKVFMETNNSFHTPAFYMLYGFTCGLLVLDIVWSVLIVRVVVRKFTAGSLEDVRSDVEDLSDEDGDDEDDAGKKKIQ